MRSYPPLVTKAESILCTHSILHRHFYSWSQDLTVMIEDFAHKAHQRHPSRKNSKEASPPFRQSQRHEPLRPSRHHQVRNLGHTTQLHRRHRHHPVRIRHRRRLPLLPHRLRRTPSLRRTCHTRLHRLVHLHRSPRHRMPGPVRHLHHHCPQRPAGARYPTLPPPHSPPPPAAPKDPPPAPQIPHKPSHSRRKPVPPPALPPPPAPPSFPPMPPPTHSPPNSPTPRSSPPTPSSSPPLPPPEPNYPLTQPAATTPLPPPQRRHILHRPRRRSSIEPQPHINEADTLPPSPDAPSTITPAVSGVTIVEATPVASVTTMQLAPPQAPNDTAPLAENATADPATGVTPSDASTLTANAVPSPHPDPHRPRRCRHHLHHLRQRRRVRQRPRHHRPPARRHITHRNIRHHRPRQPAHQPPRPRHRSHNRRRRPALHRSRHPIHRHRIPRAKPSPCNRHHTAARRHIRRSHLVRIQHPRSALKSDTPIPRSSAMAILNHPAGPSPSTSSEVIPAIAPHSKPPATPPPRRQSPTHP